MYKEEASRKGTVGHLLVQSEKRRDNTYYCGIRGYSIPFRTGIRSIHCPRASINNAIAGQQLSAGVLSCRGRK